MIDYSFALFIFYRLLVIGAIIVATFVVNRLVIKGITRLEPIIQEKKPFKLDTTHFKFFKHFITAVIYLIGAIFAILAVPPLKTVAFSLLASSGIIAVIAGFASQQTFSNIISGLFLDIFRPFEVGDKIKVGKDYYGYVEDITLRHTVIKTSQNNFLMIPNATLSNEIIENETWADKKVRMTLDVYLDNTLTDLENAMQVIRAALEDDTRILTIFSEDHTTTTPSKIRIKVYALSPSYIHIRCWLWAPNSRVGKRIIYDGYQKIQKALEINSIPLGRCTCLTK